MGGIDRFISKSLSVQIKKQLSKKDLRELEHSLFLEDGMSIKLAIEHFSVLHNKIKHVLKTDPTTFEGKCLEKLLKIKNSKNLIKIRFVDHELIQKIFESLGNKDIKEILISLLSESKTIPEILDTVKIPKTSAYRKIENLILDGIIVETGKIRSASKRVSKYRFIVKRLNIQIKNNSVLVEGELSKEQFEDSEVLKKLIKF